MQPRPPPLVDDRSLFPLLFLLQLVNWVGVASIQAAPISFRNGVNPSFRDGVDLPPLTPHPDEGAGTLEYEDRLSGMNALCF